MLCNLSPYRETSCQKRSESNTKFGAWHEERRPTIPAEFAIHEGKNGRETHLRRATSTERKGRVKEVIIGASRWGTSELYTQKSLESFSLPFFSYCFASSHQTQRWVCTLYSSVRGQTQKIFFPDRRSLTAEACSNATVFFFHQCKVSPLRSTGERSLCRRSRREGSGSVAVHPTRKRKLVIILSFR